MCGIETPARQLFQMGALLSLEISRIYTGPVIATQNPPGISPLLAQCRFYLGSLNLPSFSVWREYQTPEIVTGKCPSRK